ncbi:phage tail protein [Magnetospirillum molischianum]|uniref:Tail Collar domain protein n=1 Tax=Magnetospirillum molischianum DSM 120 TaxID=1150626 RepID=H8FQE1_MAGML|nr:tail fiber protein [Magnetospirillum molischianum]CCG40579.1 Tail Collar domain protein [Magnetospirillum molischianum DSM 120]
MTDNFLGELRFFSFGRVPRGWLPCNGQILTIQQYQALFALIQNTYGGDGKVNFALPDLRGRVAVGMGQSAAGGTIFQRGKTGGSETVTLTATQIPPHVHEVIASQSTATTAQAPSNNYIGVATASPAGTQPFNLYAPSPTSSTDSNWVQLHSSTISSSGGAVPHENRQPVIALQACIATQGLWPSRD